MAQSIQITKYRGSGFSASEFPVSFGPSGLEVGAVATDRIEHPISSQRITAGFERLDAMLAGGVFRGSSTLVTGVPGTSKTSRPLAPRASEAREWLRLERVQTGPVQTEWAQTLKAPRKSKGARKAVTTVVLLRLYVTGKAPNSLQAIANLAAICKEHLAGAHKIEIVDILEQPRRAMADGVLVSPSLTKVFPLPGTSVVGNLSDKAKVLGLLGLNVKAP